MQEKLWQLADMIKELRKERGLTQEQLAEMAGISVSHLPQIESHFRTAGIRTYLKLMETLDAPKEKQLALLETKSERRLLQQKFWRLVKDCNTKEMNIILHTMGSLKEVIREEYTPKFRKK